MSTAGQKPFPTQKRSSFALKGHSRTIDPRRDAVRPDLADIRLAEHVFAPHYAAPMPMTVVRAATLRLAPDNDAELLCTLAPGELVEVLDLNGAHAWGIAPDHGFVGYVERAALALRTIDAAAAE